MTSETKLEFSPGAINVLNYAGETARLRGHKAVDSSHLAYATLLSETVGKFLGKLGIELTYPTSHAWEHLVKNGFEACQNGVTPRYAYALDLSALSARKMGLAKINSVHLFSSALKTDEALADELLKDTKIDQTSLQEAAIIFQREVRIRQTLRSVHDYLTSPNDDPVRQLAFAWEIERQITLRRRSL